MLKRLRVLSCFFVHISQSFKMSVYHDEVEIEDMDYDEETESYYYACPCGDKFEITKVFHQYSYLIRMVTLH